MESYLLDWANLLLRWLHVITAIAWVGSSFYFVFLNSNLIPPKDDHLKEAGVDGELWAVHGGGFYNKQKYLVIPKKLPDHLHWFNWESYSTWLSGFALFTVSYLWSAGSYLIDKSKMDWAPSTAVIAALAFLAVFWLLYDVICLMFGQRKNGDTIVGALAMMVVCVAAWLACQWFAGRAAFLLVGAMIATAMSANVLFRIIPGQRIVVKDLREGRPVDPLHGMRAKQRSVHNTYFTLPVLFAMLSNHYSFTYNHEYNWVVLIAMMFAGAAIRQFFVMRHGYKLGHNPHPMGYAIVGVVVLISLIVWLRPQPVALGAAPALNTPVVVSDVKTIMETHCASCHGPQVQMKNLRFDQPGQLQQNGALIYQQVVVAKTMPLNNSTGITQAERDAIGRWFEGGMR